MTHQAGPDKAPDRIAGMFDAIAPRYDFLNHALSLGIDRRWRARAIRSLRLTGRETLLDVCTGTADVALQAEGAARVVGVDFAAAMLRIGLQKVNAAREASRVTLVRGDATALPVPDAAVDAATIAFGIRNVERPDRACAELARVMRPGAPVVSVIRRRYCGATTGGSGPISATLVPSADDLPAGPSVKSQILPPDSATNPVGPAAACACATVRKFSIRQKSGPAGSSDNFFLTSGLATSLSCAVAIDGNDNKPDTKTAVIPMRIRFMVTPPSIASFAELTA